MNVIVEVATAEIVAEVTNVVVFTTVAATEVPSSQVATSAVHVVSISGHSISAVAPDTIFGKEPALAAA